MPNYSFTGRTLSRSLEHSTWRQVHFCVCGHVHENQITGLQKNCHFRLSKSIPLYSDYRILLLRTIHSPINRTYSLDGWVGTCPRTGQSQSWSCPSSWWNCYTVSREMQHPPQNERALTENEAKRWREMFLDNTIEHWSQAMPETRIPKEFFVYERQ